MIGAPFFSIVIPTRNRPKLFQEALQSALLQEFDDFEVVVSNNSSDKDTPAIIEMFRDNPHLLTFRPDENLSMPEHWEFATRKAHGRFVLVLTDRSVLKRHALKTIHAAICSSTQDVLVCSWRWSLFDDSLNLEFADNPVAQAGEVFSLPSRGIIQNFASGLPRYLYELPRGLNSCYRHDLADEIRGKHGALFFPASPDFTSAFLLLSRAENILFLDSALFISQGLEVSNGGNASSSTSALDSYMSTLNMSDYYAHVPIKKLIVENLIFEDFLNVQEMAGGRLSEIAMDWRWYFVACYREILEKLRVDITDRNEIESLFLEWERALATFDGDLRQQVMQEVPRLWRVRLKNMLRRSLLGSLIVRIRQLIRMRRFEKNGRSILEIAGFKL